MIALYEHVSYNVTCELWLNGKQIYLHMMYNLRQVILDNNFIILNFSESLQYYTLCMLCIVVSTI